jgi:hypothetical protein
MPALCLIPRWRLNGHLCVAFDLYPVLYCCRSHFTVSRLSGLVPQTQFAIFKGSDFKTFGILDGPVGRPMSLQ